MNLVLTQNQTVNLSTAVDSVTRASLRDDLIEGRIRRSTTGAAGRVVVLIDNLDDTFVLAERQAGDLNATGDLSVDDLSLATDMKVVCSREVDLRFEGNEITNVVKPTLP